MHLFWNIRYFDRNARDFMDRELWLNTATLDPAVKMAVELTATKQSPFGREILKYRNLFQLRDEDFELPNDHLSSVGIDDYFEDEEEAEISLLEAVRIQTGSHVPFLVPSGTKPYEIEYLLNAHIPMPCHEIDMTPDQIHMLAYFSRDLEELISTVFYAEGSGSFQFPDKSRDIIHTTSVTGDQIRAHLMIFRRLYMANKEEADFLKASSVFQSLLCGHPISELVKGRTEEYVNQLKTIPKVPHRQIIQVQFESKKLIDVFMYSKYLHQPNTKREKEHLECLEQVGGRENYLNWMFLSELHSLSMRMKNAGLIIASWFGHWCKHHNVSPPVVSTTDHKGIGANETRAVRDARLFHEKVKELELVLWQEANKPEGGPIQFRQQATTQIQDALNPEM